MTRQTFPPRRDHLTPLGEALRRRFPIRITVEPWLSASCLYPTHWRITLRLFGLVRAELNRPFRSPAVDPWWTRAKP